MKLQGDIIFEFLATLYKLCSIGFTKTYRTLLEMELPLRVVIHCESRALLHFFYCPKQISCWNSIRKCVWCAVTVCIYRWYIEGANTLPYDSSNSWFVLAGKRRITTCTSQGAITHNGRFIFNTAFHTFLWSNCYTIFTVLPETQNYISLQFHVDWFTKCREKK